MIMSEKVMQKRSVISEGICLEYILIKSITKNGSIYSIKITETNDKERKSCRFIDVARSEEKALSLLHLLSTNAVCPASAPYVIDDLAESMTFC